MSERVIGLVGDSMTSTEYLPDRSKSFANLVAKHFGARANIVGKGGRVLASFLPVKRIEGPADFPGQWRQINGRWAFDQDGWREISDPKARVGELADDFDALLASPAELVLVTHTGTNDWQALHEYGAEQDAHGARHTEDQLREIVRRLLAAGKRVAIFTDATTTDPVFHGIPDDFMFNRLSYHRNAGEVIGAEFGVLNHSCRAALKNAAADGNPDFLLRNAKTRPKGWGALRWRLHQALGRDLRGTNSARLTTPKEDALHAGDAERRPYFFNQHLNYRGHEIVAAEIIATLEANSGLLAK